MIIFNLEILKDKEAFISHVQEKGHFRQREQGV